MMFGKVAPAPVICTCAPTGAAMPRRTARASRGDFVIFTVTSSELEDELRLEQELRPGQVGKHGWGAVAQVVPVEERPELGVDLVGCPGDVAGEAVSPHARRHGVDTRDHSPS